MPIKFENHFTPEQHQTMTDALRLYAEHLLDRGAFAPRTQVLALYEMLMEQVYDVVCEYTYANPARND